MEVLPPELALEVEDGAGEGALVGRLGSTVSDAGKRKEGLMTKLAMTWKLGEPRPVEASHPGTASKELSQLGCGE